MTVTGSSSVAPSFIYNRNQQTLGALCISSLECSALTFLLLRWRIAPQTAFSYCTYLTGSFSNTSYVADSKLSFSGCSGNCDTCKKSNASECVIFQDVSFVESNRRLPAAHRKTALQNPLDRSAEVVESRGVGYTASTATYLFRGAVSLEQ